MQDNDRIEEISELVDQFVKSRRRLQALVIGGTAIVVISMLVVFSIETIPSQVGFIGAGLVVWFLWRWGLRTAERELTETVLRTLFGIAGGFKFQPLSDGLRTAHLISQRLFRGGKISVDQDQVNGNLAGVDFLYYSTVISDDGGDDQKTVFKGYIIEFPISCPQEAALIRPSRSAVSQKIFSDADLPAHNLKRLEDEIANGENTDYAVYIQDPDVDNQFVGWASERIRKTNNLLPPDTLLYGFLVKDGQIHLAIKDKMQLFRIGGLFASKAGILGDINIAMSRIMLPLKIIKIWQK